MSLTRGSNLLRFDTMPAMKRTSPIKTQICAALTRSCRYREAPMHRNTMLNSRAVETKNKPHRTIILYIVAAAIIILGLYYLPNYFLLEKATADSAAFLLNSLGMNVQTRVVDENVFLSYVFKDRFQFLLFENSILAIWAFDYQGFSLNQNNRISKRLLSRTPR